MEDGEPDREASDLCETMLIKVRRILSGKMNEVFLSGE
jgi:hypothetical protein